MLNKKIWLVLGLMAMGCAANTESAPVETNDETEESSDSLSSRRLVGTYARLVDSVDGCQVVSRLELDARGRFSAQFDYSAVPGRPSAFLCAAVIPAPLSGTWSATSRGRITLRTGRRVVASAVGNGNNVRFTSSSSAAGDFAGTLARLDAGSCLNGSDCDNGDQCVLPMPAPCAPGVVCSRPSRLVGFCAATPGEVDAGSDGGTPGDAGPPPAVDAGSSAECGPTLLCGPGYECRAYGLGAPCEIGADACVSVAYSCELSTDDAGAPVDGGSGGGSTTAVAVVVNPTP